MSIEAKRVRLQCCQTFDVKLPFNEALTFVREQMRKRFSGDFIKDGYWWTNDFTYGNSGPIKGPEAQPGEQELLDAWSLVFRKLNEDLR